PSASPSSVSATHHAASGTPLRIQTDINPTTPVRNRGLAADRPTLQHKTSASSLHPISRTPSVRAAFSRALGTASGTSSTVPSPIITAMGDVTPLPSPLLSGDSPGPWRRLDRPLSRDAVAAFANMSPTRDRTTGGESITAAMSPQKQRKPYGSLSHDGPGDQQEDSGRSAPVHTRNRSVSEYVPDPMHVPKRMATVSGSHPKLEKIESPYEPQLRREPHLSEARGLTPIEKPPTPPPSESSLSANESASANELAKRKPKLARKSRYEYFEAYNRNDNKLRRWRAIKSLGQGTFSRVMLATSQTSAAVSEDEDTYPSSPSQYDRRTLVAVKVCEHGPHGGASEDRIEMSLKRELQIMQCIHHPSLVRLKAWNIEPTRALLVMSYCPGGDLFDVASKYRSLLTPSLLRRIFAELVGAVSYLHERRIVHRDIKLENVLVNIPPSELSSSLDRDWTTYPHPVINLADLGLSRRIADDEKLETRCGSDDYAAPEVIMGQPYDGRATDAWSLGVLLYALLEGRLPFDPAPGVVGLDAAMQMRMRSRTSHRIARVEWRWIEFGVPEGEEDGDGEHEADVGKFERGGLGGAREVVEALLKRARSRWPLDRIKETEWVRGGINVEGGIKFRDEDEGE
ncbi:kinase-like protein, partial [Coniochaeta ligniaria NRRL 30616]